MQMTAPSCSTLRHRVRKCKVAHILSSAAYATAGHYCSDVLCACSKSQSGYIHDTTENNEALVNQEEAKSPSAVCSHTFVNEATRKAASGVVLSSSNLQRLANTLLIGILLFVTSVHLETQQLAK